MKICSFFGHRNTVATPKLCREIKKTIECLIKERDVQWFLFGSASRFDDLCLKMVTELQKEYPKIKRMYVRSHFPYIEQWYKDYLLESYDDTLIPSRVKNAGKASYVERNQKMIDASDFCVFYYDLQYKPPLKKQSQKDATSYQPKSGTALAYAYAKQKKKEILNLFIE